MLIEEKEKLLKSHRRTPICLPSSLPVQLDYKRAELEKILPHREPFLLVDCINGLDIGEQTIAGEYHLSENLPLFDGHFPGYPIYPGCLQVEAIGQLGLCLVHFIGTMTDTIEDDAVAPNVRATSIAGAYFRSEVRPGDTMILIAKVVEHDSCFGTLLGQALVGSRIASVALLEVAFLT